jgi:hypothetical protein
MSTTPTLILMAITHTPIVIMVLGRGVRVAGVMVDGDIMVLGVRVTGGIADSTFFGKLHYNDLIIPFSTLNDLIGWLGNFWATLLRRIIFTLVRIST